MLHALLPLLVSASVAQAPVDVRVGLVAYEDFHREIQEYEGFFAGLSRQDPSLRFQITAGTYGDVLHWLDRRLIDVAVLTPGDFASLAFRDSQASACRYLATIELPPARSPWASSTRRADGFHARYHSVCLVSDDSEVRTADALSAVRDLEFVFVHPMSVSGRLVPLQALRASNVPLPLERIRYSYSHAESIRMLREPDLGKRRVAFVWDDASRNDESLEKGVRKIDFPALEEIMIPHDVVVCQPDFEAGDRLEGMLDGASTISYRFKSLEDWQEHYSLIRSWVPESESLPDLNSPPKVSLDEIARLLLQYSRSQPQPPRLAVVFSGGGAKCSYQVGAVSALEEKLAELRRVDPEAGLDISLVVGTSGGAINAVPVALKVSSNAAGREAFRETWKSLDQREIVRPSLLIRASLGLWFATLQTALVICVVRWLVPDPEQRGRPFALIYTGLAAAEVLLGYLPLSPWHLLGTNHIVHHAWLWLSFGIRASAWCLLVIGLLALCQDLLRARNGNHISIPEWFTKTTVLLGVLGIPILQLVVLLFFEETLSSGDGMRASMSEKLPQLIDAHLRQQGQVGIAFQQGATPDEQLEQVSRQVLERRLFQRDLVITGSCLEQSSSQLPSDLYFFAKSGTSTGDPPFGSRGVSLQERPEILLDVVLGSGSIFPVFPPRKVKNFPSAGEYVELVDGGFAHNSPVEAAVLWGATHIVLIEATPRRRSERGSFVKNASSSFRHLHQQAQLLDARSRGKVSVFALSPEPPHMCVLDFADNLIVDSVERGYRDVRGQMPRFQRELGEPVFVTVLPAAE